MSLYFSIFFKEDSGCVRSDESLEKVCIVFVNSFMTCMTTGIMGLFIYNICVFPIPF